MCLIAENVPSSRRDFQVLAQENEALLHKWHDLAVTPATYSEEGMIMQGARPTATGIPTTVEVSHRLASISFAWLELTFLAMRALLAIPIVHRHNNNTISNRKTQT